ncbi:hypothetical protein DB346_21665 [Verrucomicrobia bacterium LW23]|nr:hypothetical protein DB346_21665 [Verrucomicrobia bacterium LW23]
MKIQQLCPILVAHQVDAAVRYYVERLGFTLLGTMGAPTEYAIVERDGFAIHFKRIDEPLVADGAFRGNLNEGKGGVYITVADVDAVATELVTRGAIAGGAPEDKDYGMRDFWVADPFGYVVCFGSRLAEKE